MTESVQLNFGFFKTVHGIFKQIQIIFAFAACILVGSFCISIGDEIDCVSISVFYGQDKYGWQGLIVTVLATTIIINFIQLMLHFFNLNKVWTNVNWRKAEMIYAAVCFILYFICMALEIYFSITAASDIKAQYNISYGSVYVRWLIGAILGFIVCGLYAAEAYMIQSGRIES
uniref:MARVEL domain-containing protein n=1 Tax=Plectus sambesii TaxID=2011161 RepID=A0A914WCK9_9BILA